MLVLRFDKIINRFNIRLIAFSLFLTVSLPVVHRKKHSKSQDAGDS